MSADDEYNFISFVGEVLISGKKFSCRGRMDYQLKYQLKNFIAVWSDIGEWHEAHLTEEEQSEDIVWKMVHEHSKENTAFIRMIYNKPVKSPRNSL